MSYTSLANIISHDAFAQYFNRAVIERSNFSSRASSPPTP